MKREYSEQPHARALQKPSYRAILVSHKHLDFHSHCFPKILPTFSNVNAVATVDERIHERDALSIVLTASYPVIQVIFTRMGECSC